MDEIFMRGWANLIDRIDGPMSFRVLVQPAVAIGLGIRGGLRDARAGRTPLLWSVLMEPGQRGEWMRHGRKDVGSVFLVALVLDAIYQVITHAGIYTLELLITAVVLAIIPYCIVRSLIPAFTRRAAAAQTPTADHTASDTHPRSATISKFAPTAALSKEGEKLSPGRYGSMMPVTPANGFTIIARVKPGRGDVIRAHGKSIEKLIAEQPHALAPLRLHYLRWVLFDNDTRFLYIAIFDTVLDVLVEDAVMLFEQAGVAAVFEQLEGFPEDSRENPAAFARYCRDHQAPSFIEYAEYPEPPGSPFVKGHS